MDNQSVNERGSFYGKRGNQFERDLVKILNQDNYLIRLKEDSLKEKSFYKIILDKLLKDNQRKISDVSGVSATNTVPRLKNNGNPKTDIILKFKTRSGEIYIETISLKTTNKKVVSCHEYPAVDFIRVLRCENTRLAEYLTLFQKFPSYKATEQNCKDNYSITEFSELLTTKSLMLSEWALKGMHDIENLVDPKLQVSNYLLIWDDKLEQIAFYSMDDYIKMISTQKKGRLGVPFSWTYPSKRRGKKIQLKVPILFE